LRQGSSKPERAKRGTDGHAPFFNSSGHVLILKMVGISAVSLITECYGIVSTARFYKSLF
jgi:hypothetical protein